MMDSIKFAGQFFGAVEMPIIHFAPAIFELGEVIKIQVQLPHHLFAAQHHPIASEA